MRLHNIFLLFLIITLSACASGIPPAISERPAHTPSVDEARRHMQKLQGTSIRWGGKIASIENRAQETWLEIVAQPLNRYGRPQDTDAMNGRFLARLSGFLDPQIYTTGRQITITGKLEKTIVRNIGDFPYTYPLVQAEVHYLWPPLEPAPSHFFYYDTLRYDLWYPWGYPPHLHRIYP